MNPKSNSRTLATEWLELPQVSLLFGEAGTGKTTLICNRVEKWIHEGVLSSHVARINNTIALPFLLCSYTNGAVQQFRARAPESWPCYTIHKALEYRPDGLSGEDGTFHPQKGVFDRIDGIKLCVVDEITQINVELYEQLRDALPDDCKIILTGDFNQLPPVYGVSLMTHALSWANNSQFVGDSIVLKTQRRQTSSLLRCAHTILEGKPPQPKKDAGIRILNGHGITNTKEGFDKITNLLTSEGFMPGRDILLCPVRTPNKLLSCHHFCRWIAEQAKPDHTKLKEILPFDGLYLQEGDIVVHRKEEWIVEGIEPNPRYSGDIPAHFVSNRYGHHRQTKKGYIWSDWRLGEREHKGWKEELAYTLYLRSILYEERKELSWIYSRDVWEQLDLSGATTIHKAEGNEWDRVFLVTLATHNHMITRQLLYTAVTRAKKELIWITSKGPRFYGPKVSRGYQGTLPTNQLIRLQPGWSTL